MSHSLLNAVALPEAENTAVGVPQSERDPTKRADALIARVAVIATELAGRAPEEALVDWDIELAAGRGPCLALGAERRSQPR